MAAFGFAEILMLAILSGGFTSADIVTLVQPKHYFQTRQIEISVDKAIDYAGDEPKTAKTQIVQLSALRYLADESDSLLKSPRYAAHRKTLEHIAAGKKAADPQGFAQDYASRVLMKLDNAKPPVAKVRPLRADALSWFPATVTMAFALDLQPSNQPGAAGDPLKDLLKMMPDRNKKEMYDFIEQSGNIRVERVAFAMFSGTGKREDQRMYLRFTGKGNHDWAVATVKTLDKARTEIKQFKDDQGMPIAQMQSKFSPSITLIGNTDVIVAGFDNPGPKDNEVAEEIMAVRAKKKPNASEGALKARLAKVPDKAVAFLVGDVPDELKRDLGRTFNPMPTSVTAFVERVQQGLDVQVESSMTNAQDADKLVQRVADLRQQGIQELKKAMGLPQPPGFPVIPYQSLINLMETLQVNSKTDQVKVRVFVPDTLARQLGQMSTMWFGAEFEAPPPPPPAKEEKK